VAVFLFLVVLRWPTVRLGENLAVLPAPMFEYISVIIQIPSSIERSPLVLAVGMAATVVVAAVLVARYRQINDSQRTTIVATWRSCGEFPPARSIAPRCRPC